MFEILNYIVDVHAQVCSVSPNLLDRTLNALIGDLIKEASRSFEKIRRFGTGGLLLVGFYYLHDIFGDIQPSVFTLQAVMEMTFIHKSLGHYGRDSSAGRAIEDIYTKQIPKAYAPSSKKADFQTSFEAMQKVLAEARRASGVQFLCFRKSNLKELNGPASEKGRIKHSNKRE